MRTDKEMLHAIIEIIEAHNLNFPNLVNDIRARLAEPEDEPVAWMTVGKDIGCDRDYVTIGKPVYASAIPLYRHPRQPVRLSDDEIQECFDIAQKNFSKHQTGIKGQQLTIRDWPNWHFAKAIEQAIMEKNK